jgi:glycosyltransferase involved in cell wall biosynthesis
MFSFLQIISPTWYYNLLPEKASLRYWADINSIDPVDREVIDEPSCYSSRQAAVLDMSYQAWVKGVIVDRSMALSSRGARLDNCDEYRFIRRHFNPIWSVFALAVRLAEFNNPIEELKAFLSSSPTKRVDSYQKTKNWGPAIGGFHSALLEQQPKVTVIIPTLNRYKYLADVLGDLEKQDYRNFEVLVVDQSNPYKKEFYEPYELDLRVWYQEEPALWHARNTAIAKSEGEFILLFDDDSRVGPDWIRNHIRCIDYFEADISSGVSISVLGAKVPETYSYYKWGDQIDTGNVMLKKEIFRKIGLFDLQFEKQRQGDGEFGLRAYLAGYANISNPDAARLHLKVAEGGLREMGSWDGWRPKKFFSPRPIPSVLYLTRKYFGTRAAVYQILHSVFPSVIPYRFKRNRSMMTAGLFLGLLLLPIIFISVIRSWMLASRKLQEGPKIPRLG